MTFVSNLFKTIGFSLIWNENSLSLKWRNLFEKCVLRSKRGKKYKKVMDQHIFSDNSNFLALSSVGNKLEKWAGKFELSEKSCWSISF